MHKASGGVAGIRRMVRARGWDLVRYPGGRHADHLRGLLLVELGVDLVIDVGANVGQYGTQLRDWGYRGRIMSFEPMRDEYAALSRLAEADGNWDTTRCSPGRGGRRA